MDNKAEDIARASELALTPIISLENNLLILHSIHDMKIQFLQDLQQLVSSSNNKNRK